MVAARTKVAHIVFFTLKDSSPAAVEKLVAACNKYLSNHPGTVYYSAGHLSELSRPVNDRDYHVGLHVVFESMDHQNAYQTAERHQQFIAENKENWAKVRVFDSYVG